MMAWTNDGWLGWGVRPLARTCEPGDAVDRSAGSWVSRDSKPTTEKWEDGPTLQPNPPTERDRMWMLAMTLIALSALTLWAALIVASDADDQLQDMRDRAEALRALERLQDG